MAVRTISFGKALEWLEAKKAEMLRDERLMNAYKNAHHEMKEYAEGIQEAEREMEKYSNSITAIKNGIIAIRGNKEIADGMVTEMNKKVEKLQEWETSRNACMNGYAKAKRLVENYDRDTEKELFFFWQLLHDCLPDLTPNWSEFKEEHKDFYYKNHL